MAVETWAEELAEAAQLAVAPQGAVAASTGEPREAARQVMVATWTAPLAASEEAGLRAAVAARAV